MHAALGPLIDSFLRTDKEDETYPLIFEHDIESPVGAPRQGELERPHAGQTPTQRVTAVWVLLEILKHTEDAICPGAKVPNVLLSLAGEPDIERVNRHRGGGSVPAQDHPG